jgi:hypothetical protein
LNPAIELHHSTPIEFYSKIQGIIWVNEKDVIFAGHNSTFVKRGRMENALHQPECFACRAIISRRGARPPHPDYALEGVCWPPTEAPLISPGMLNAKVKTCFVLIPKRDMVIHCGTQPGENAHQQQVHCNDMQPRFVHAFFAASAVPVYSSFCRNLLAFNNTYAGARGSLLEKFVQFRAGIIVEPTRLKNSRGKICGNFRNT